MKYSPTIKYLLDLVSKASKSILRDFHELGHMQGSVKPSDDFIRRSIVRSSDLITDEINYQKRFVPNIRIGDKYHDAKSRFTILANPLDGVMNFQHAVPLFSISVGLKDEETGEVIASIVELPALREVFFAEKNNSAWHDSYISSTGSGSRLRVAKRNEIKSMYFSGNFTIKDLAEQTAVLNCPTISACFLSFGRFDACFFNKLPDLDYQIISPIIFEAGGIIEKQGEVSIFANDETITLIRKLLS
jgi:fructose-1,6-bisphosphatase/inositol monophosphatase family enzyme